MRGRICEFALADPNDVEHELTSLDNIGGFERLKIGASFRSSTCNKRTPRFFVSTVHCIAASFKSQSSVPRTAYPFVPNHSTAAAASIRGHATSSPALKAATRNSDGKSGGNNSEGIVSSPTRTLSLCGAEFQRS